MARSSTRKGRKGTNGGILDYRDTRVGVMGVGDGRMLVVVVEEKILVGVVILFMMFGVLIYGMKDYIIVFM